MVFEEEEIYNVIYKYKKDNGSISFEVINKKKPTCPETLFKYYALNENSIDALTHSYVYASHPNQLNDVFDVHHNMIKLKDDEKPNVGSSTISKNLREGFYRRWGILSLTTQNKNILMWSYYTNNKGFSVEFDYSKFRFTKHGPFPINYVKEMSPITENKGAISYNNKIIPLLTLIQSNIKQEGWKHEDEWRFLIQSDCEMISPPFNNCGHNRKFKYPIEAIKSITLGIRFFEFDKQIDEIEEVSKTEWNVIINDNRHQKSLILDFIEINCIPINFINGDIIKNNIFGINYIPNCKVESISPYKYKFTLNNIKKKS